MNTYLLIKTLHILSSVVLVGTGFGSAFYLFMANRSGQVAVQATVARLVVRADWWFTTPTIVIQPLTGYWLMQQAGWGWQNAPWLRWAVGLYAVAGACWLPVVWLQCRMARDAHQAHQTGAPLPARYARDARLWEALGYPAFAAMLAIYALMVFKPS